ncbi:hypothetical protein WG899_05280 [Paucibacter sp. AS339]|uniref:hypothetical protein n=1 Tax=Paucibacter hankyongi TaxID=3133434 RepID=UPI0030ADCFC8
MRDFRNCRHHDRPHRRHHQLFNGLFLIAIGSLFLLERQGLLALPSVQVLGTAVLALLGLGRMLFASHPGQVARGAFWVLLAGWLYASLEHLWGLTFHNSWPLLLIAFGLSKMVDGLARLRAPAAEESR